MQINPTNDPKIFDKFQRIWYGENMSELNESSLARNELNEVQKLTEPERLELLLEASRSSNYLEIESLRGAARAVTLKRLADETGRLVTICGEEIN